MVGPRAEFDALVDAPEWDAAQVVELQFDEVFAGGADRVQAFAASPVAEIADIVAGVTVMVGELANDRCGDSQILQGSAERLGVADGGDGADTWAEGGRRGLPAPVDELVGDERDFGDGEVGCEAGDFGAQTGKLVGRDEVGPGDEREVGATQTGAWFAEQAPGEQMPVAPGVERVDQDEIEVPGEAAVLEAIVEDQQLRGEFFAGNAGGGDAVGVLQMGDIGAEPFENEGFVVESGVARPVPPAEEADADVAIAEPAGEEGGERCFAGTTGGEVTEADDGKLRRIHP